MSETETISTPDRPQGSPPRGTRRPVSLSLSVAVLALLVGGSGLAAGGWSLWQWHRMQQRDLAQANRFAALIDQAETRQQQNQQRIDARLAELPSNQALAEQRQLLLSLQADQQQMAQRLSEVLGASRESWRLAEAEHLLRLAMLRLSALQDVPSAIALVQGADDILRAQHDPLAFAARGQLIKALEALRSLPQPDREGLFLQLDALREQLATLPTRAPQYQVQPAPAATAEAPGEAPSEAPEERWTRWWDRLSRYLRLDLHADQDIRPLLAGASLAQLRLTLSLTLQQAQWAALNAEPRVYQASLQQATTLLDNYFDRADPAVQALRQRLEQLAGQPVAVEPPDLRPVLLALQAYLEQRERQGAGEGEGEGDQPEADGSGAAP